MLGQAIDMLPEEVKEAIKGIRAEEPWILYDHFRIQPDLSDADMGVTSYSALANAKVSLLNQKRKRTTAGLAYCNMERDGEMTYGMAVFGLGIVFKADEVINSDSVGAEQEGIEGALFESTLPRHTGFILRVNQDEKLLINGTHAPGGTGSSGFASLNSFSGVAAAIAAESGLPVMSNCFDFGCKPLILPRGTTIEMIAEFMDYARTLLQGLLGPGYFNFVDSEGAPVQVPKCSMIGVHLLGLREAMLRDAYPTN